jgi:hypothetical protein
MMSKESIQKRNEAFIGRVFGRLKVIEFSHVAKNHVTCWKCVCDCGKIGTFRRDGLMKGTTKSCGCLLRESVSLRMKGNKIRRKPKGESGFGMVLNSYRKKAEYSAQEFDNSDEFKTEFRRLTKMNCHYCGVEPRQVKRVEIDSYSTREAVENSEYVYNGIDRIDSNKGYVLGNIVSCCYHCNLAKSDYPVEEFREWLKRAYQHFCEW